MFKRLLAALVVGLTTTAFAADVNKATALELAQVKGIGPAIAERIVVERKKGGDFKSWPDLIARVKGVGQASAEKFSANGLTVNGQNIKNSKNPTVPNQPHQKNSTAQNPKTSESKSNNQSAQKK